MRIMKSFHVRMAFIGNVNGCLCAIACAFRWGVTLVGKFNYWALFTPSWETISGTECNAPSIDGVR